MKREVVIYCMSCSAVNAEDLPWDRMTYFNHAFWRIEKKDGGFPIVPCFPEYDFGPERENFRVFEQVHEKYPELNIMISVGGAGFCRYFSEAALTKENRASFIQSCIGTLQKYPFLAGIDIDWEFPGVTYNDDPENPGCLKVGNDKKNYPQLLKEMRLALDAAFGAGAKKLTVCCPASGNYLAKQGVPELHQYVDLINIMTYDLDGCDRRTGHHSALYRKFPGQCVDRGVRILQKMGVPKEKLVVGSPLYSHGGDGVKADKNGNVLCVRCGHRDFNGIIMWHDIKDFETQAVKTGVPGWHTGYDAKASGAYIWNDDPGSGYFGRYMTYESEHSLDVKLDYIKTQGLGGIIVWQADGDDHDGFPMITRMSEALMERAQQD